MKVNTTRQKLLKGQSVFGVFAWIPTPEPLEIYALLGYDFVMIDGEHGPISETIAGQLIRVAAAAGITPLARVPRNEAPTILRMLDQGAQGIMVLQVNSRAEAERVVAACKYYPQGTRGMAPTRSADYGIGRPYREMLADINREVMVIIQIENIAGVETLDEILQVEGIDVVFIGPGDLSQSLGKPAQWDAPEVLSAIERVIAKCKAAGVTVAILPTDVANAQHYAALGVIMQGVGDTWLLAMAHAHFCRAYARTRSWLCYNRCAMDRSLETTRRSPTLELRRFRLATLFELVRAHPLLAALLATIVLLEIVHGVEMLALFPLYLSEVEGESASLIALTISTYLIVDILSRTPAGWLADRVGRKPVLLAGIVLSLAPLPIMMQTRDQEFFLLLNALNGLGAGCTWPSIYASIADTYGTGRRGLIFGLVNTVMLGGLASGPISGNLLIGLTGSFTLSFLFCSALVLLTLLIVAFRVQETKSKSLIQRSINVAPLSQSFDFAQDKLGRRGLRLNTQLILLFMVVFCLTFGIACLVPIVSLYGRDVLHLTNTQFGLTLALPAIATAIALVPFGHWVDRYGRKWPLVIGMGVFALCLWLSPISTFPPLVSIGATLGGLSYALAVPSWNALAMDRIPREARGTLLGMVAALQGGGLVIGPYIGGTLWEQVSPFAPFLAAAFSITLGAVLALFVHDV